MAKSDSSEELYSLSTTTANIFDFDTTDVFRSPESLIGARKLTFLGGLLNSLKTFFINIFRINLEIFQFLFYLLVYLRSKVFQVVAFLDLSKDRFVDTLMWRRGLLFRPATHGGVLVVSALAIIAGGLFTRGQIAAQNLALQESVLTSNNTTETIVPTNRPRSEVVPYAVASGDTLSSVSTKFNVSVESVRWANSLGDSDTIQPGSNLKIPPVSGVVYQVKEGDTLDTVAKYYSADKQTIADFPFNYIDDTLSLRVGQTLYVPDGVVPKPVAPAKPAAPRIANTGFVVGSGMLSWPVAPTISQYFSWYHTAIDIARPYGTPIYAAASGRVIDSKKQTTSFGWYCIVDIGNGYTVAYAHMSNLGCYEGQWVERGQYIGAIGTTGRATGPHLHLEVRRNGVAVNPLSLLK